MKIKQSQIIFLWLAYWPFDTLGGDGFGSEAQHSKHHQRCQHRRHEVDAGHGERVAMAVVVPRVVGWVRDHRTETQTQSEEDLSRRLTPHLNISPDLQLREIKFVYNHLGKLIVNCFQATLNMSHYNNNNKKKKLI